jgi:YVTN family beta-propeller protein
VVATLDVGNTPVQVNIEPRGRFAYTVNQVDGTLSVIDIGRTKVVKTLSVGSQPNQFAILPNRNIAYVVNKGSNNLTLVDDNADADSSTPSADSDAIAVLNDAVGFQAAPPDTINLELLNDAFGFDFDVLDITGVTDGSLSLVGDDDDQDNDATLNQADAGYTGNSPQVRDIVDFVRVGSLDLIDEVGRFSTMIFTDASIASAGDELALNIDAGELEGLVIAPARR